jgi:TolB-like protein/Flp pilus assembly protein TadD
MGGESPKLTGAVFLSYASQDAGAAQRICEALRAAGVEVWLDQSELRGGDAWDQSIREQIKACALFVPLISANAHARVEGYFRLEWKLAVDRSHLMSPDQAFLLPVVIDDTPQADKRIPERFRELQWTRLPGGQATPAFIERVQRLLSPEPSRAPTLPASGAVQACDESPRASWWSRPALLVSSVVVAAVLLAYFVVDKGRSSKRPTSSTVRASANLGSQSATLPEKSIAVLPFVDLSEKHDQEYFADGMAEEILDILAKIPSLKVIGRTSSFQFKGRNEDLRAIGTSLGAAYVLEGSVRRSADRVRVTAQLIDTRDGTHVWSGTYDRPANDALLMQGEIATSLSRSLEIGIGADRPQSERHLKNDTAYDLYLRGRYAAERGDADGFADGVTYLRQALDADPGFADAAVALALTYYDQAFESLEPSGVFESARQQATSALTLNPKLGLAHAVLGAIHNDYDWDWAAADLEFKQAIALAPHDGRVLTMAADHVVALGQLDRARQMLKQALAYDPLLADAYSELAWTEWCSGRYEESLAAARKVLEIDPTYDWGHFSVGQALLYRGDAAAAITEFKLQSNPMEQATGLALAYHALGRATDSTAELTKLISGGAGNYAYEVAEIYAYRGERDDALKWLERAYVQKDATLKWILRDPTMAKLESDPRYKAFLQKMKLAQ